MSSPKRAVESPPCSRGLRKVESILDKESGEVMMPAEVEEVFPLKHKKMGIYGQWMVNQLDLSLTHQRQSMVVMAMKGELVGLLRHMGDADPYVVVHNQHLHARNLPHPSCVSKSHLGSRSFVGFSPVPFSHGLIKEVQILEGCVLKVRVYDILKGKRTSPIWLH
jgi:hypothetical protein